MKQDSEKIQVHVLVSGRVQGVGYRYSTVIHAEKLGLKGWVKNLADGRVEAVFEGDKQTVEQMLQWCHQGPSSAIVKEVKVELGEPEGLEIFAMRY